MNLHSFRFQIRWNSSDQINLSESTIHYIILDVIFRKMGLKKSLGFHAEYVVEV